MRLKPELSASQAFDMLSIMATATWGLTEAALLEPQLRTLADAMAVIGALDIPDDTEPLFGEDVALDPEYSA